MAVKKQSKPAKAQPKPQRRLKHSRLERVKQQARVAVCSKTAEPARRWAGCTGLQDVPLLPPLFTNVEDTYTRTLVLQVYLRLCVRAQIRPVGIQVDDLEGSFGLLTSALQSSMPALVRTALVYQHEGLNPEQRQWIQDGGVIIDQTQKVVYGMLVGQDPLHVFFRLSQHIDWQSLDSAYALRCLRKLLRSWNYEDLAAGQDEGFARAENQHDLPWITISDEANASVDDVLSAYFHVQACPQCAFDVLAVAVDEAWNHPISKVPMPRCAKAVILDDLARKTTMAGETRSKVAKTVHALVNHSELTEDFVRR